MACGTVPKIHILPADCDLEGNIKSIAYTGDDIDYTLAADGDGNANALISDIVTNAGEGFYALTAKSEGEGIASFKRVKEAGDGGASTDTTDFIMTIDQDSPEVRSFCDNMYKKKVDLRVTYNGTNGYPFEITQDIKLIKYSFDSATRHWTLEFKLVNPETVPMLVWNTDYVTTLTMIEASNA